MSHLNEWVHLIAKQLKSEAELVGTQAKSELYEDVARDTFIRVVLKSFLPGSYAIGSGRVIDSSGNMSSPQDIVIYRKDYPQFNMPGSHHVFIYESVLATIQVRAKLVRKSFFKALDQCASMAELEPFIEPETRRSLAAKMNLKLDANKQYVHAEPLNTERYNLIGRPPSFIYAFTGYQTSEKQLAENLNKWIDHYHQDHTALHMKSLPSVIATQGCFAWRNTAPFTMSLPALMGVGSDTAPLRLIILQLMQAINRRLQNISEGYGIRSSISPYLAQFERPVISKAIGKVARSVDNEPVIEKKQQTVMGSDQAATLPHSEVARQLQKGGKRPKAIPENASSANPASVASNSDRVVKKPVQTAQKQVKKETRLEDETAAPLIEDRSSPRLKSSVTDTDSTSRQPQKVGNPLGSPLSLFDDGEASDAEEYDFQPIEPSPHQSNAVEDDFEATQQIDLTGIHNTLEIPQAGSPPDSNAPSKVEEEEVNQDFLDTLIEEPEVLTKNKSKPAETRPGYVKESLI